MTSAPRRMPRLNPSVTLRASNRLLNAMSAMKPEQMNARAVVGAIAARHRRRARSLIVCAELLPVGCIILPSAQRTVDRLHEGRRLDESAPPLRIECRGQSRGLELVQCPALLD